jgi:hypothetical protein
MLLAVSARLQGAPGVGPLIVTRRSASDGFGSEGADASPATKLKALVRSPVADRRHALSLGASTPNGVSMKRSSEVWSNLSEQTRPPGLKGDTTSIGTRKPRPIGPANAGSL